MRSSEDLWRDSKAESGKRLEEQLIFWKNLKKMESFCEDCWKKLFGSHFSEMSILLEVSLPDRYDRKIFMKVNFELVLRKFNHTM